MKIDENRLKIVSLSYLYIPVLLFVFGWTHMIIAVACTGVWGWCAYRIWKQTQKGTAKQKVITVDWLVLVVVVLFFLWIGYYAGWGRWVDQASDWYKHNAVLADLVNRSWPVYYTNGDEHSMLVYYIAQYLVPAAVGKMFHSFRAAEIMLFIWNEIGLFLVFFNIVRFLQTQHYLQQFCSALLIPFFTIPLWLSELVLKRVTGMNSIGNGQWFCMADGIMIQYSSNYTMLRWVFPQAIAIWLIVILFLDNKERIEYYLPLMLPAMLFGTFGFLGIIPLALGYAAGQLVRTKDVKGWLRRIFSVENVAFLLTMGSVFLLYFYGNVMGEKPDGIGLARMPYTADNVAVYFVFVAVNVLIYAVILWKDKRHDSIYYMAILSLLILPLCKMGRWNDLTMRASIPALFVLMIYVSEYLYKHVLDGASVKSVWEKAAGMLVVAMLLCGMYYPFAEFSSSVQSEDYTTLGAEPTVATLEWCANRQRDITDDWKYNYYAYEIEDNLFYRFVARK